MSTADVETEAPPKESAPPRADRRSEAGPAWLFIAPFGIFFVLFLIWPVIYMFISSMFDTTLVRTGLGGFIGFENYAEMLTREDFWEAMWHTIQFTLYTTPPLVILAFVFAVLAQPGDARSVVLPAGLLRAVHLAVRRDRADLELHLLPDNRAVELLPDPARRRGADPGAGQPGPGHDRHRDHHDLVDDRVQFRALPGGTAGHPTSSCTRLRPVNGATPWQQIRFITIPMLSRTTTLVVLLQIIASLKIFDQVYLMTQGGPGTSTQVVLGLVDQHRLHGLPGRRRLGRLGAAVHRHPAGHGGPRADRPRPREGRTLMATGVSMAAPAATVHQDPNQSKSSSRVFTITAWVVLLVFSVLWLIPSLWSLKTSLTPNEVSALGAGPILKDWNLTLEPYATILSGGEIWNWYLASAVTSVVTVILTVIFASMAAYAISRLRFRGRRRSLR